MWLFSWIHKWWRALNLFVVFYTKWMWEMEYSNWSEKMWLYKVNVVNSKVI